jgi:hypothetical protein
MGRQLTVLTLATVLLVSVVGIGVATAVDESGRTIQPADSDTTTISVSGNGEVTAEPDRALVFIAVTATGEQPSAATEQLANETARLRETLAEADAVDSVATTEYQLFERRENTNRSYVARQSFEVTVSNTSVVGSVVDAAVSGGATEVNGVAFTLSTDRRQELRDRAIDRAVADAREKANATAASTDLELRGIESVSTGDSVGPFRESAVLGDAGTVIDEGPVTVSASVQITYTAAES